MGRSFQKDIKMVEIRTFEERGSIRAIDVAEGAEDGDPPYVVSAVSSHKEGGGSGGVVESGGVDKVAALALVAGCVEEEGDRPPVPRLATKWGPTVNI